MIAEVNLKPGWLARDVKRAAERVLEWSHKCPKCGEATTHVCSWVCVDMCQKCDRI